MSEVKVRAKMKVQSINKSGSPQYPQVSVNLGAVYSNDPESENRSFASATPSASVTLNIDAGRPAANGFELGQEFYVDFIPLEIPTRWYIGDNYPVNDCDVVLENRDGSQQVTAGFTKESPRYSVTFIKDGETVCVSMGPDLVKLGWTHWKYVKTE